MAKTDNTTPTTPVTQSSGPTPGQAKPNYGDHQASKIPNPNGVCE